MTTELFFAAAIALSLAAAIIVALTRGDRTDHRVQNNSKSDMIHPKR